MNSSDTPQQPNQNVLPMKPGANEATGQITAYRFDVFKGGRDSEGKIHRIKSVGTAYLPAGAKTYTLYLKTFTTEPFYLLPESRDLSRGDYGILTRVPSASPKRKYFWNNVGEARFMVGLNKGLLHLVWDLFGVQDIYMSMNYEPVSSRKN